MAEESQVAAAPKSRRESAIPLEGVLSFDEFVERTGTSQVEADGLYHNQIATSGVAPRALSAWQDALTAYQNQS
jgi:hypothetical protein